MYEFFTLPIPGRYILCESCVNDTCFSNKLLSVSPVGNELAHWIHLPQE